MKNGSRTDYDLINNLYMSFLNEQDLFKQRSIKERIKSKVSRYDFLMYSIRFAIPFQAFKDVFPLSDLLKTLEEMEKNGEDISTITNKPLIIQGLEDIQALNHFSRDEARTQVSNLRLKFQGNSLFKFGDVKKIGKKFPHALVNFIDLESVEQMINGENNYKGVPIIITIDNMGELPLDKLGRIEERFNVIGVRIIEKDRNAKIEERPISVEDYKKVRTVVDNDIINKLYVTENMSETVIDAQLATQIFCLICDRVRYDKEAKIKGKQMSLEDWYSYYSDVSNITGLVTGKTICGGYAEILRNVLSCVGIDSKTIVGETSSGGKHAWNQIKLGTTWFNTDLTFATGQIREGNPSGDLFMSDVIFFGDRRYITFQQGENRDGNSIEIQATVGGHTRAFNSNVEKCASYLPPYITTALLKNARGYKEEHERNSKSSEKSYVPYVGSSIEKRRCDAKNIKVPTHPGDNIEI